MAKNNSRLEGKEKMKQRIQQIASFFPSETAKALFAAANYVLTISKAQYVPVDLGNLKNTGTVEEPIINGKNISVAIFYGGPAAPYAFEQHENLDFAHNVGQAKYLETPLNEFASQAAEFISLRIKL